MTQFVSFFLLFATPIFWSSNGKEGIFMLRVSTAMQHSGLEAQKRALEEWCKKKEITGYIIYEDENQSGTKSSRPALDKMMKDVRAGGASTVVV